MTPDGNDHWQKLVAYSAFAPGFAAAPAAWTLLGAGPAVLENGWKLVALVAAFGFGLGIAFGIAVRSGMKRVRVSGPAADRKPAALGGWRLPALFAGWFSCVGVGMGLGMALAEHGGVSVELSITSAMLTGTAAAVAAHRLAKRLPGPPTRS